MQILEEKQDRKCKAFIKIAVILLAAGIVGSTGNGLDAYISFGDAMTVKAKWNILYNACQYCK